MRNLTELIKEAKANKLEVQDDSINYISSADLKKYLEVANNFLSKESKEVINWLIVNNASYISDLSTDDEENALAGFYNAGVPKSDSLKELYKTLGIVIKSGRFLEIPVFQTKDQFEAIINKKESPDSIILDLTSEKGRNKIARQYKPLIIKMCNDWNGKSRLTYDDLMSAAYEGLTWAMNGFGKKTNKNKVDQETIATSMTFGQYAAYMIRSSILMSIENESKTVREPKSAQQRERKEKGFNRKTNSVSGDKAVGNDEEGGKTLFDYIGDTVEPSSELDREDMKKLQAELRKAIEKEFGKKVTEMFYELLGLDGGEEQKNKDIAKKYGITPSNVTYYKKGIYHYIRKNPNLKKIAYEIVDLVRESNMSNDNYNMQIETPRSISKPTTNMFSGE